MPTGYPDSPSNVLLYAWRSACRVAMIAGACLFATQVVYAQRLGGDWAERYQVNASQSTSLLGRVVAGPGDLSQDGVPDVLAGAPLEYNGDGAVYAYSGIDGQLFWVYTSPTLSDAGRAVDAAGDLNGDGRPDVILGAPGSQEVVALRHDSSILWRVQQSGDHGISVAGVGDLNLDGFDDVAVGDPNFNSGGVRNTGAVYLYSGSDGALIHRLDGQSFEDKVGGSLDGIGDLDGDGVPDILIGAPTADPGGLQNAGFVYVVSGSTGALIYQLLGWQSGMGFGKPVAATGDLDGDGFDDFAVGAPEAFSGIGMVQVYSGRTGGLLYQIEGRYVEEGFGKSISTISDVDSDGVADLVVGSPLDYPAPQVFGRVAIHSGATGDLLDEILGNGVVNSFAFSVAAAGDLDGDLLPDVIVGAHNSGPGGSGQVSTYTYEPFLVASSRELSLSSGFAVQLSLEFPISEAGQAFAVLISGAGTGPTPIGGIEVPLTSGPILNQMLSGWAPPNLSGGFGVLSAGATAAASVAAHPVLASEVGRTFYLAAVSYESGTLVGRRTSVVVPLMVVP